MKLTRLINKLKAEGKLKGQFFTFFNDKIRKLYRKRKYIIKEIIDTEQRYVADLQIAYEYVVEEFIRYFGQEEAKKVFSNLKEIIQVNENLLNKLQMRVELENRKYRQKYKLDQELVNCCGHENSILFSMNQSQVLFNDFEKYFEYCEKYEQCKKLRTEMEQNNENYLKILRNARQRLNKFELENYLSMPFQRLPRYILLLGDLKKNTPAIKDSQYFIDPLQFYHPDYDNIVSLIEHFEKLNQKNNEKIGEFQDAQKMIDIQQRYGNDKWILHNNKRKFVFEENIEYYINSKNQRSIILVGFNDSILLIENEYTLTGKSKKKCLGMNEFSLASEINRVDSNKGFMFKVTTKQKVYIFVANDEKQYLKIERCIRQCIEEFVLQKREVLQASQQEGMKWDNAKILVSVEGTEEFDAASIDNYTVFIIKLELEGIEWKIYKRYKSLLELYKFVSKHDSNSTIGKLQRSNWIRRHDNKYLDAVKINIERFVQSIFQWEKFEKYKRQILIALGIPLNFNLLPQFFEKKMEVSGSKSTMQQSNENEEDPLFFLNEQLNQKFLEDLKLTKILTEIIKKNEKGFERTIKIQVPLYVLNDQNHMIKNNDYFKQGELILTIDNLMKAIELCEQIAIKINLQVFYDFRLVVIDSRGNQRVLESNQIVLQSLPEDDHIFQKKEQINQSFSLFNLFEDVEYQLYFQKYIFFPAKIERQLYIRDKVRLLMLINYLLRAIKNYQLSLSDYSLIYALFIIIFKENTIKLEKGSFRSNVYDLENLITTKVRKSQLDTTWNKLTENYLLKFYPELKKLLGKNSHNEATFIPPTIQNFALIMLTDFAFSLPLYGLVCFYVSINMKKNINESIGTFLTNELPNIYLGISFETLHLLSPGNRKFLHHFPLMRITQIKVEPVYLYLEIQQEQTLQIQFKTSEGYKISQLINEYKSYNIQYNQQETNQSI